MSKFINTELESESELESDTELESKSELESDNEKLLRKINSHSADFKQVKKLIVILLPLNK